MSAANSTTPSNDGTPTPTTPGDTSSTPASTSISDTSATQVTSPTDRTSSPTVPTTTPTPTTTTRTTTSTTPSSTPTTSTSSTTTSTSSTTSSTTPTTSSTTPSSTPPTTSPSSASQSTTTTVTTSTRSSSIPTSSPSSTSSSASPTSTPGLISSSTASHSSGLSTGGTIAVAVVVPIVAVALLVLAGLFFWRKRKARKDAEDLRRKEVEEYGYNPNNDPSLPAVATAGGADSPYEMREDGSSGYRGWGTTAVASSAGRKASTTISGGMSNGAGIGMAYSEGNSPGHEQVSDSRSENPLVEGNGGLEHEELGVMGPAASANRNGDINRGPSNASSSYSAANRSDGSGDLPGGAYYSTPYDAGNPYNETSHGSPPGRAEMSGQPVIRDVQARRNTRIENPSHFPQQSAGISQNF